MVPVQTTENFDEWFNSLRDRRRMSVKIKTRAWDAAEHLRDEEDVRLYIEAAQEEASDDAAFMAAVLGDVARARNMAELARQTGVARATLYKVTRGEGNPTLHTVGKLARALGFRLSLVPLVQPTKKRIAVPASGTGRRVGRSAVAATAGKKGAPRPTPARK